MIFICKLDILKNDDHEAVYHGYGYTVTVKKDNTAKSMYRHISVEPDYLDMMIYPDIKFWPTSRKFTASIPEVFSINAGERDLWNKSLDNVFLLLDELNQSVPEFVPDGCLVY